MVIKEIKEATNGTINISGERFYEGVHYYILSTDFSVDALHTVRSLESQLGFPVHQMGYSNCLWVQADKSDWVALQKAIDNFNNNSLEESLTESDSKDYKIGDTIKFDGNYLGVTPRISTGTIIGIKRGLATHGNTNPDRIFKIRGINGNEFSIDECQIVTESIHSSNNHESTWLDPEGVVRGPGEVYTYSDLQTFWELEHDYDVTLMDYLTFEEWFDDVSCYMELIN